jgi:hypothetical protein
MQPPLVSWCGDGFIGDEFGRAPVTMPACATAEQDAGRCPAGPWPASRASVPGAALVAAVERTSDALELGLAAVLED